MEMLNDSQNEMEFKDDSRFSISSLSTSSTCERKQQIESNIQTYTSVRQVTKRERAQNFSIHNYHEHPEYKSLKNSIRLFNEELKRLEVGRNSPRKLKTTKHRIVKRNQSGKRLGVNPVTRRQPEQSQKLREGRKDAEEKANRPEENEFPVRETNMDITAVAPN
ncbi:hypothetical protein NPIL_364001 [Nephila pilipes]|uniref:Uncharacterized protein n=1 Tax=Nephila pilipes TaxID=299642 RepID=A0A8X6NG03_NEPPI|nr:hypothetical protein NPIL_364001 [Nephila pilipes]